MYRYRDTQGRIHTIADEDELRAAIADGRIGRVSPFAAAGEPWTAASRHPAFQKHQDHPAEPSTIGRITANPRDRKFASIAGPLLALVLGIWARRDDPGAKDHAAFEAALAAAAEGTPIPAGILANPPRRRSDRVIWVVLAASADAEKELTAAEERFGILEEPDDWLRPGYLLRARSHEHVARYFAGMQRFHTIYRDSLVPIADRALRQRASQADLKNEDLEALLAANSSTSRQATAYFDVTRQWAREALRLHQVLVSAESSIRTVRGAQLSFTSEYWRAEYESTLKRIEEIEARRNAMQAALQAASARDFQKFTGL